MRPMKMKFGFWCGVNAGMFTKFMVPTGNNTIINTVLNERKINLLHNNF